ncbi:hypothetical protein BDR07DRAFT_1375461 [Suillus spraguei]|nr:hypothetical protein BDR07DRAFT_1375461 [Suillus spraguei]
MAQLVPLISSLGTFIGRVFMVTGMAVDIAVKRIIFQGSKQTCYEGSAGKGKDSDTKSKTKPKVGQPACKSDLFMGNKNIKPTSYKEVPAPQHKCKASQTGIINDAAEFFASNVKFLEATADSDTARLKLLKTCELQEDKQHNYLVEKGKAEVDIGRM